MQRLFPLHLPTRTIAEIARKLVARDQDRLITDLPAGYTYVGQMISHDIVPMTSFTGGRVVTPQLNLDSLYGDASFRSKAMENGKFIVCPMRENQFDIYRIDGKGVIPEGRNDENVIISQLHALWLELHNHVVDLCGKSSSAQSFERARTFVTLVFQHVVLFDFLEKLTQNNLYQYYIFDHLHEDVGLYGGEREFRQIPEEFSKAAFRFGHSMILSRYILNDHLNGRSVELDELFRPNKDLTSELLIDWDRFFFTQGATAGRNFASAIDLPVAEGMADAPFGEFVRNIVVLNIEASMDLPSGKYLMAWIEKNRPDLFRVMEVEEPDLNFYGTALDFYKDDVNQWNMPLWLYILRESNRTDQLGALGSLIVLEVLKMSIKSAEVNCLEDREVIKQRLGDALFEEYVCLVSAEEFSMTTVLAQIVKYREKNYE